MSPDLWDDGKNYSNLTKTSSFILIAIFKPSLSKEEYESLLPTK
jgi:hypothetical protein